MAGPNDLLTKAFIAGGAITKGRIVKFSADDTVVHGAAKTDLIMGVAIESADSGARVDVQVAGIADVKLAGTIARGAMVTCSGAGVGATSAAVADRVIGVAMLSGVADDLTPVLISPYGPGA